MPLLLWPFPSGVVPPPPSRTTDGKIFVLDTQHYGGIGVEFEAPFVGENCAMVMFVGNGLPTSQQPVLFTFTKPDGTFHLGSVPFSFIGTPDAIYYYGFPANTYLVYLFDVGELDQAGTWTVQALTTNFVSLTYNFVVFPAP